MSTDALYPTGPQPSGDIEVKLNDNVTRGELPAELAMGRRVLLGCRESSADINDWLAEPCEKCGGSQIDFLILMDWGYGDDPPELLREKHCRKCKIDGKAERALEDPRDKRKGDLGGLE